VFYRVFSTGKPFEPIFGAPAGTKKEKNVDCEIDDAWILQHKYFYETILVQPDHIAQIAKYNVLQAQLDDGYNALLEAIDAASKKLNAKAEAQKATELKSKAWQKLILAMRKYHNVMKAVLEEDPQMKEKLGIVTPIEV